MKFKSINVKVYLKSPRDLNLGLVTTFTILPTLTHHETFLSRLRHLGRSWEELGGGAAQSSSKLPDSVALWLKYSNPQSQHTHTITVTNFMAQLLCKAKRIAAARGTGQASVLIQISSIVNSRSSLTIKKEHLVIPGIG